MDFSSNHRPDDMARINTPELADAKTACDAIDLLQAYPAPIANMCANIRANDKDGMYNGAYRVVQLACNME